MRERGIVLQADDKGIRQMAKRRGLPVEVQDGYELAFERTLFLRPTIRVPWDLLSRGFDLLDRWEMAAPVWSYETLAGHVATGAERDSTAALIGDLRVLLYNHELLFARRCAATEQMLGIWQAECAEGADARLGFLRALYQVKPLYLALPRSWLTSEPEHRLAVVRRKGGLVSVEIAPGQYVRCFPNEVEKVKRRLQRNRMTREERRRDAHND